MKKLHKQICNQYANSNMYSLFDGYNKPSQAKFNAWQNIESEMCDRNGHSLKLLSYNTFNFTCAYRYYDNILEKPFLVYHTHTRCEKIDLSNMYEELGYYFG